MGNLEKYIGPERAEEIQSITQWIYMHECLESGIPKVRAYRAVENKFSSEKLRSWESLTTNKRFAEDLCREGSRVLVEFEIPVHNVFASYLSSDPLYHFGENEAEILLNQNGGKDVVIASVKEVQDIKTEKLAQLSSLIEEARQKNIPLEGFIVHRQYVDLKNGLSQKSRDEFDTLVKEKYQV